MTHQLSQQRKMCYPDGEDTWASIAARELPETSAEEAINMLQSWNLHIFMRPAAPAGSPRDGNPILPCDIVFLEPPAAV